MANNAPQMAPADAAAARKVVMGCSKILFDKSTHDYLVAGLKADQPMPVKLASQVVGVMKLFASRAQGEIPRQVLLPAGAMLILEVAKFIKEAGFGEPTGKDIAEAGPLLEKLLLKAFPPPGGGGQPAAPQPAAPQPGLIGGQ